MENSKKNSGGVVAPKKNRSLDLKSLYKPKVFKVGDNEKRVSVGNDQENVQNHKRKSGKEVSLSRFESDAKKSRKGDEICIKPKLGDAPKSDLSEGLKGMPLTLGDNGSVFNIPKRPRGSARRKKMENNEVSKQLDIPKSDHVGSSGEDNIISVEDAGSVNRLSQSFAMSVVNNGIQSPKSGKKLIVSNSKSKEKADSGPTLNSATMNSKLKRKAGVGEFNETTKNQGGKSLAMVVNPDEKLSKKPRKKINKGKDLVAIRDDEFFFQKISEPQSEDGRFIDLLDDDDDDEENLEKNAARMLSSRFDPSCTGFSSKRTSSPQNANGFSSPVSSPRDSINRETLSSGGGDYAEAENNRALRPRREDKGKNASRKRRHFYEFRASDLDGCWMLNRRIKIFWPLDESWYDGLVDDYRSESKLHHIKYDDKDEEWIDLQKEKFKLLLLPSEFPGKAKSKKQYRGTKDLPLSPAKDEIDGEKSLDLEPIASWLTNSSQGVKTLPRSLKKQKASQMQLPLKSSLSSEKSNKPDMAVNSVKSKSKFSYKSVDEDSLVVRGVIDKSVLETNSSPRRGDYVVYFRRKFRKRTGNNFFPSDDKACGKGLTSVVVGFPHTVGRQPCYDYIDCSLNYKNFKFLVCLPSFCFPEVSLGKRDLQLIHDILMIKHGVLASSSPAVVLDMLLIDTNHGLSFLLYEGCLKKALAFVFHVLVLFDQVVEPCDGNMKLPVTSLRFGFSRPQNPVQQNVFSLAVYSFARLRSSMWSHLESEILQNCFLIKQLPASNFSHDSIKGLEHESLGQQKLHVDLELFLKEGSKKKLVPVGVSAETCDTNLGKVPNSFLSLHLHSLMEHCVAQVKSSESSVPVAEVAESSKSDPIRVTTQGLSVDHEDGRLEKEDPGVRSLSSCDAVSESNIVLQNNAVDKTILSEDRAQVDSEKDVNVNQDTEISHEFGTKEHLCEQMSLSVPISIPRHITFPASNPLDPSSDSTSAIIPSGDDGFVYKQSLNSTLWPDGKTKFQDGFSRGPKRPRTQVLYTLPLAGYNINSKQKTQNQKSLPCKRIRRASEKKTSNGSKETQKNLDTLVCIANVLVTHGDQGWRECGARVLLELADHNEWRIAVKLAGLMKYSYKVKHMMQPGSCNRFTNAMMWKGGKDWVLEFSDRGQWSLFKDMYEECYNRNMRAASVKNIPIPGVQLTVGRSYYRTEIPFVRNPTMYIRQFQSDVERALDQSRVLYDMDSDDEQWLMGHRNDHGGDISEDYFEKIMDMLEKVSFVQRRNNFSETEIEELLHGTDSLKAPKLIYEHWLQKREKKGMPLIRHLQPPLWEIYQNQTKDWERTVGRSNFALSSGPDKASIPEKPPMFAFCLKPRGLDVPNKVSKQRSQRRLSVTSHHHSSYVDQDSFLSSGRRSNDYVFEDEKTLYPTAVHYSSDVSPALRASTRILSPRDARFSSSNKERDSNPYRKVFKSKSRKLGRYPSFSNQHATSYDNRAMVGNKNGANQRKMVLPQSSTQGQYHSNIGVDQLNDLYLEEFRVRDAANTAKSARRNARIKREKAQRLLNKAEAAIHKAAVALMTAEAMKESCVNSSGIDTNF